MAAVTGSSYPDEESFSRRGSGAGRFQQSGGQGFDIGQMYQDLMNKVTGKGAGSKVTGDIGESGTTVTFGGGGRGSGQGAARTTGGGGGAQPGNFRLAGLGQSPQSPARLAGGFGIGATALGLAPGALSTFQEQGLGAATASTSAGLGVGLLTAPISNALMMAPHPLAKVAGFGLQALAPALAQQGVAGLMGKAEEAAQTPGAGPNVSVGNVPLTATAADAQKREYLRTQGRLDAESQSQAEFARNKEIYDYQLKKEIETRKALMPLEEQTRRNMLINTQAINASNAALYQQMGRTATMGKLALGAQAEAGETTRAVMTQNPYAGSVLQAPQISF